MKTGLFPALGMMALLLAAFAFAQEDLDTARNKTVEGDSFEDAPIMMLRLTPLDADPPTPVTYPVTVYPSSGGSTFSQPIRLFPGRNKIEVTSSAGSDSIQVSMKVKPPRLRVQLTWAGAKQDYDLYVNDIYYGNNPHDPYGAGELDRDVRDEDGPATENITFAAAEGGLYRIYVNYYADNDVDDEGNPKGTPQPTTVLIFIDEERVHYSTRTIATPNTSLGGDGVSVWSVCTLVLHSGSTSGGFTVNADGNRDILPQKTVLPKSISPRTDFTVEVLAGPDGTNDVFVPVGKWPSSPRPGPPTAEATTANSR